MPLGMCWKCGEWITEDEDYEENHGFYTCSDCTGGSA